MKLRDKLSMLAVGLLLMAGMVMQNSITSRAAQNNCLIGLNGGVAAVLELEAEKVNAAELISNTAKQLNVSLELPAQETDSLLVMAKVNQFLNVRELPSGDSKRVGMLYKDCGGTILERQDGWTKIQTGNLVGWCNDTYLYFGEEAKQVAKDVGIMMAVVDTDTLRVRNQADKEAEVLGLLPKGEMVEVINVLDDQWIMIDYDGQDGYVLKEFVQLDFKIDAGETNEEIKVREKAELEAKRHRKYAEYATDEDTAFLLAALIHCEAVGESYEGQVAVGAVVMNRVRSAAYPNTIYGVIYASGQFTPAMTGKLDRLLESGKVNESCIRAANEALAGTSNVGDMTHFRRNNGREGLVIGNHVFY